jgi:shikimate dehydrogenase
MTDRYAVIGNPIEHSKSPRIHQLFAAQTGQDILYERLLGDLEDFSGDVRDFFRAGGKGLNITVPFKEQACQLADRASPRAEAAGAVNTLILEQDGRLLGDNTDGVGLITDLGCNHRFHFAGANLLLVGAGGAARGVARPLLQQGVARLVIANRTAQRAIDLADSLGDPSRVQGVGLDGIPELAFDLIVNATAASISGSLPQLPPDRLASGGWVYDMMYGGQPTAFVRWGMEQQAARSLDGLGMLVEQAAESFFLWRGVRPDTEPVITELRNETT